jgi:hypothetical protein
MKILTMMLADPVRRANTEGLSVLIWEICIQITSR